MDHVRDREAPEWETMLQPFFLATVYLVEKRQRLGEVGLVFDVVSVGLMLEKRRCNGNKVEGVIGRRPFDWHSSQMFIDKPSIKLVSDYHLLPPWF